MKTKHTKGEKQLPAMKGYLPIIMIATLIVTALIGLIVLISQIPKTMEETPRKTYMEGLIESAAEQCPNGLESFDYKGNNPSFTCK